MDSVELQSESSIKLEEVKQEPVESDAECIEEDSQRSISVKQEPIGSGDECIEEDISEKSEFGIFGAACQWRDDSEEEEVKPPIALFLQPNEEVPDESAEERQDPLATSDDPVSYDDIHMEKTGDELSSLGWRDRCWEAGDQRSVQRPREGGGPRSSACAVSLGTEHTLNKSTTTDVKLFQCVSSWSETNTVASQITHSERRHVCSTGTIFPAMNAFIVIPILNVKPASAECSGAKNIDVHAEGKSHVSANCEKLKEQQNPSTSKTNLVCEQFSRDESFLPGEKLYECVECKENFRSKENFVVHLLVHKLEKPHVCGECKKRFSNKSGLVHHIRIHTGEKPYECVQCKMRFIKKSNLVTHSRIHTGKKPFKCGECKKRFRTYQQVVSHSRIHTGEKPYECGQCKMRFRHASSFVAHKRRHTGSKPYECDQCKMRFTQKSDLILHMRVHTGERPYECEECKKRFRQKSHFVEHSRMHTGEKPYECGECKKRFTTKSGVLRHNVIHTGEKPYECGECKKRFNQKSSLVTHSRIHKGEKPCVQSAENAKSAL